MLTFFITDAVEMRRCKHAQFSGRTVDVVLNGKPVTGIVHSVMSDPLDMQTWIVHLMPKPVAPINKRRRPVMRYG